MEVATDLHVHEMQYVIRKSFTRDHALCTKGNLHDMSGVLQVGHLSDGSCVMHALNYRCMYHVTIQI